MVGIVIPDGLDTLAARLRWAMEYRRMSQSELSRATATAAQIPLSQVTISKIVRGAAIEIRAETLFRLAGALSINPEWLRTGAGHPLHLEKSRNALDEAAQLFAQLSDEKQQMILAAIRAISDH